MPSGNLHYIPLKRSGRHSRKRGWTHGLAKEAGTSCWICGYEVSFNENSTSGLRASVDHVIEDGGVSLKLAHAWCNSRRGSADTPLTEEMRRTCRQHIMATHGAWIGASVAFRLP